MANLFDSSNAATVEPLEIIAGDLLQWKRTDLTDYDNNLYTLKYSARLASGTGTEIEITATAEDNDFLVSESSATTANYTSGTYYWQAYVTRDSDSSRITIDSGLFKVLANSDTSISDPRTHARLMVDKIESLLEGRADNDVDNYAIAGRSITKMSIEELMSWRSFYQAEVSNEEDAIARRDGKSSSSTFQVRFS